MSESLPHWDSWPHEAVEADQIERLCDADRAARGMSDGPGVPTVVLRAESRIGR